MAKFKYEGVPYEVLVDKVQAYTSQRRFRHAKEICCELLCREPLNSPRVHFELVKLDSWLGLYSEALERLDLLLDQYPQQRDLELQKLVLLDRMGCFDEALALATTMNSDGAGWHTFNIIQAKEAYHSEEYSKAAELVNSAIEVPGLTLGGRAELFFLSGAAYDKLDESDRAMDAWYEANRCNSEPFQKKKFGALVDRLIHSYRGEAWTDISRSTNMSEQPVFLVSMARSGSSLLNQIVDCHPDAEGVGETGYFVRLRGARVEDQGGEYPQNMIEKSPEELNAIARGYLEGVAEPNKRAKYTLDKSIDNFRDLGVIWQTFPKARFIYLKRDPLDCCLSIYQHRFVAANVRHYTSTLEDIGYVYRQHERLLRHWRTMPGISILDVKYEELTSEPEAQIRRILDFLKLPWDPKCLKFHESKRGITTLSVHQVRKPINRESVGKSEKYAQYLGGVKKVLGID